MKRYESLLKSTILLQELNFDEVLEYYKGGHFKIKTYNENNILHFEGEICNKLEIILSGEIAVERLDESGGILTIAKFVENHILGGNLLFSNDPIFPMTITAKKTSIIAEIDKELLFELFVKHPSFLRKYLEYVSDHTSILGNKIRYHVKKSIRESLMGFLEYESKVQNSNRIMLNMTKKELADKIGVQRTSLSRELAKMKKDGLIDFDGESISLLGRGI